MRYVPTEQIPGKGVDTGPPASRAPYDRPDDPDWAAVVAAQRRGLDPKEVLAERRRVLKSRGR